MGSKQTKPEDMLSGLLEQAMDGNSQAADEFWRLLLILALKYVTTYCRKNGIPAMVIDDAVQETIISIFSKPFEELAEIESWGGYLFYLVQWRSEGQRRRLAHGLNPEPATSSSPDPETPGQERPRRTYRFHRSLNDPVSASDEHGSVLEDFIRDPGPTVEKQLADCQLLESCRQEIAKLPQERRRVFCLYLRGLTIKEISEETGVKESQVTNWIYRIKVAMKMALPH